MNCCEKLRSASARVQSLLCEILQLLIQCENEKAYELEGYSTLWEFMIDSLNYSMTTARERRDVVLLCRNSESAREFVLGGVISVTNAGIIGAALRADKINDLNAILELGRSLSSRALKEALLPERASDQKLIIKQKSQNQFRVTLDCDQELMNLIELTQMMRHESRKDISKTLKAALKEYTQRRTKDLQQAEEELKAYDSKKRAPVRRSRYIPLKRKTFVKIKAGYQCEHIHPNGNRCSSLYKLEIDHIKPYAQGGGHTTENLRLLCQKHNLARL